MNIKIFKTSPEDELEDSPTRVFLAFSAASFCLHQSIAEEEEVFINKSLTKYLERDPVLPFQLNFGYEIKTEIFKTY